MLTILCSVASPVPKTYTGGLRRSLARSAPVITIAPPASVTKQHINSEYGQHIGREFITSSIVIGSFIIASGCIAAHLRLDTDTSAICSRVVP